MSEFRKDNDLLNGKGEGGEEDGRWITAKGNKIFIKNGVSTEQAIEEHFTNLQKNDKIETQYDSFCDYEDKDYSVKWTKSLPEDQFAAIFDYTKSGFVSINEALRTGKDLNIEVPQIERIQKALNEFELKKPIKVYRVCNEDVLEGKDLNSLVGKTLQDKGFMSCTTDERYALHILGNSINEDILLDIGVPAGKGRGAYIAYASNYGTPESEFLLNSGSKLRITGVEKKASHIRIKGEYYE